MLNINIQFERNNKFIYGVILVTLFTGLMIRSSIHPIILSKSNENKNKTNFNLLRSNIEDSIEETTISTLPSGGL
ncbi:MAG: hypothetical protein ACFFDT_38075 [Candidatus Hodarchaeota archaeon]